MSAGKTTEVCQHGFWLAQCPLCHKHPGECDWGSCTEPATVDVEYRTTSQGLVGSRPMCDRHSQHLSFGYAVSRVAR